MPPPTGGRPRTTLSPDRGKWIHGRDTGMLEHGPTGMLLVARTRRAALRVLLCERSGGWSAVADEVEKATERRAGSRVGPH